MKKEIEISSEIKKLKSIFRNISPDRQILCENLIQNASYMAVKLKELQTLIDETGMIEDYNHGGGQSGKKVSSPMLVYQKMLPSYNQVIKTLLSMLPPGEREQATADLMSEFLTQK